MTLFPPPLTVQIIIRSEYIKRQRFPLFACLAFDIAPKVNCEHFQSSFLELQGLGVSALFVEYRSVS